MPVNTFARIFTWSVLITLFFPGTVPVFASGKQNTRSVLDATKRAVTIEQPVKRIAFSGTCLGEALKIIGAWDKVVGRGYMIFPDERLYPGIADMPVFSTETPGPYNVNYEKLLALDVDLLLTIRTPLGNFEEMNNKIKSSMKIVALESFRPDTVKKNFQILAAVFDASKRAKAYLDWYENITSAIVDKTSRLGPDERKTYFLKWSFGRVDEFTTLSDTFPGMVDTNEILGAVNVAAKLHSMWGGAVDPEWLMQQTIDVIICQDAIPHTYGTGIDTPSRAASYREKTMALPVFASSRAVKQNKVYMISPQFMFSPSFVIHMAYMAKWLYPELFTDMDPQALHQEYLTRFLQTSFDLSKHGVFVYPK